MAVRVALCNPCPWSSSRVRDRFSSLLESCGETRSQCLAPACRPHVQEKSIFPQTEPEAHAPQCSVINGPTGRALLALTAPGREVRLSAGWLGEDGPCQHLAWFSAKF